MKTYGIQVGNLTIGGGAPVRIQSMTTSKTEDVDATVEQINRLEKAGCEIVRLAVINKQAAEALYQIKKRVNIPLVADIHFDYKLALTAIERGADKIRINPGNIGGDDRIKAVADACRAKNIPIRIGINGGSLEPEILEKYGAATPEAMVESAMYHKKLLNKFDFNDICISIKSSSVPATVKANVLLSQKCDCPVHLGVTESGTEEYGIIKSAAGIGGLLAMGIGDTIRVSLTADPEKEIEAAIKILRAVGLKNEFAEVVSCPTCGRCRVNLIEMAQKVNDKVRGLKKPIKIAVMGCIVNGPGEAKNADIGIAGGQDCGLLFIKGQITEKLPQDKLLPRLFEEIEKMTGEKLG